MSAEGSCRHRFLGRLGGFHTWDATDVESLERSADAVDTYFQIGILDDSLLDFVQAVDDGRVIAPSESISDLYELGSKELASQIHRNLSRCSERFGPGLGPKSIYGNSPLFGNGLLDCENGEGGISFLLEAFDCSELVT